MRLAALGALALGACATAQVEQASPADPNAIEVMVLGTYHLAGSNADLINLKPDDVLAPKRQAELQRLAAALAKFKPTAIALERETKAPEFVDPKFAEFTDAALTENRNERVQIGYRLARVAGVTRVYGIDEQPSAGEPDYFPFDKVAAHVEKTGQAQKFGALMNDVQQRVAGASERLFALSIPDALLEANNGDFSSPEFYYRLAEFDLGEEQPAAELQGYWFMRNAKIFSKLHDVTRPGDRIVVIYGAGHKFWLDHLVSMTPGFKLVDPTPYLRAAAEAE